MKNKYFYTEDQKAELLNNPNTFRVTDRILHFTLEFKKFFVEEVIEKKQTYRNTFFKAGYSKEIFSNEKVYNLGKKILDEYKSEGGLKEPTHPKRNNSKKKHLETRTKELEQRILYLEQALEFQKKSQLLKKQDLKKRNNTD